MSFNQGSRKKTVAPMVSVRDGARAIEFYQAAFGAETKLRVEDNAGAAVAELSVGESVFWLADESPEHQNFSPRLWAGAPSE